MEIEITGDNQFYSLNSHELSAYPDEQEVLLQDGLEYKVISVCNEVEEESWGQNMKLTIVKLQCLEDEYARMGSFRRIFKLLT